MDAVVTERQAQAGEVREHTASLRKLATESGLGRVRLRPDGAVVVHSDAPGYRAVDRFAAAAAAIVGTYVHVITDDVPGAAASVPL